MHQIGRKSVTAILMFTIAFIVSCTTDKDIKADIAQKAKNDVNFSGVIYTVNDKVVTLSGNCPSAKSRQKVWQAVKSISAVKQIINHVQILPVLLDGNFDVRQAADSILAVYPQVQAAVKSNGITLSGRATKKEIDSLTVGIGKLHPGHVEINIVQTER